MDPLRTGVHVRLTFLALLVASCGGKDFFSGSGDRDGGDEYDAGPRPDPFEGPPRPADELYDIDHVPTFELTIAPEDWQVLVDAPFAKEYVPATFVYRDRDEVVDEVGVHFQGGYSLVNVVNGKYGFTIHFNEYDGDRLWRGLRHLKLKMPGFDKTLLVEPIAYDVYREMGIFAPRANHARLFVNDDYYGVYVNVEVIDQSHISRRFRRDEGELYKIADGSWSSDFLVPGMSGPELVWRFEKQTDEAEGGSNALAELLDAWNDPDPASFRSRIREHLDVPMALTQIACDLAVDNWDGLSTASWNFFFYGDMDTGLFLTIPWGPDAAFDQPGGLSVYSANQESARKMMEAFEDEYDAILREIVAGPLRRERLLRLYDEGYDRIREYEEDDWRNVEAFETEIPIVRDAVERRAEAVAAEVR